MGTKFRINAVIEMKDNSTQNEDYVRQLVTSAVSPESTEVEDLEVLEITKTEG